MNVAELISILQQQDPSVIVMQPDLVADANPALKKLGIGEVQPMFVAGKEDLGLIWLKLANKESLGAVPALMLGRMV